MGLFTKRHSKLTGDNLHGIVWEEAADTAARLALPVHSDDDGKVVHQLDDDSHWVLVDHSVPTYIELTAVGIAAVTSVHGRTGDVSSQSGDYTNDEVGLGNVENTKVNLAGAADPAVTDDSGDGYSVGSIWINTVADSAFIATDVTVGAAVWAEITGGAGGTGTWGFITGTIGNQADLQAQFGTKADTSHNHSATEITSDTLDDARVAESNVTQHEAAIDHDALTNVVAEEHIRWDLTGAEQVHADRYATGTGGATNTVAGATGITNTGDDVNAVLEPTYGATADTIAEGDDTRIVNSAIHATTTTGNPHDLDAADVGAAAASHTHTESEITDLSHVAVSLDTTGSAVNVGAAAPPTTGQVLKATGSTTATWQVEAGGGGTDTVAGATGITNTGDDVDAVLEPTYGTTANTIAEGDDTRIVSGATHAAITTGNPHDLDATDVGAAAASHTHTEADILDLEHAAVSLETTGISVNVSAAPPPTAGQILKATSATTATWQAGGAGSAITVEDEGTPLTSDVNLFNFVGTGVTVTEPVANQVQVTIGGGAAPVDSVFTRTGAVVAVAGDYDASEVGNDSGVLGANAAAALDQLDSDISTHTGDAANPHETNLSKAILATSADNDITILSGDPVILRDGASAGLAPLSVVKTNSLTDPSTAAIKVTHPFANGGIDVIQVSSGLVTRVVPGGILFDGDSQSSGYTVAPGTPVSGAADGKDLFVRGGPASDTGNQDGGDIILNGGQGIGTGSAGNVVIGPSTVETAAVQIAAAAIPTNVLGDFDVAGDISFTGTLGDHAGNHFQGGTDELTVQSLGSGAEVSGRYIETDGVGGWTVIDAPAASLEVEDEGTPVPNSPHTTMNFIGGGVTATDAGGGTVNITIAPGAAPIDTVFGRTGTVVALASDYDASLVDNDSGVTGAYVSDALNTLDTDIGTVTTAAALNTTHRGSDGSDHSDVVANTTHAGLTTNPHATDIGNLGSGTLAELNTAVTDATLIDTTDSRLSDSRTPTAHNQAYTTIDNVPTDTFLGRDTAGTGTTEAMTPAIAAGVMFQTDVITFVQLNTALSDSNKIVNGAFTKTLDPVTDGDTVIDGDIWIEV